METSFSDVVNEYVEQEHLTSFDGSTGVKNLCRLVRGMGYKDPLYFGQFHQHASYGDLIQFLEDNPGCVMAIRQWIEDEESEEWKENLESWLPEKDREEFEESVRHVA